jgi:quercetin dioxygenase-like cupin family protein
MIRARASIVSLLPLLGCAPTSPPASCPEPPAQAATAPKAAEARSIGILPSTVEWRPAPPNLPQGAEVAVLEGDPRALGLFTMRVRLPQGYVLEPHTHARDERVTVLDGSVHIGFGARAGAAEKAGARRYVAGSYYVNPAGVAHFVFTTEPAVMQITTTGPWTLEYVAKP